MTSSNDSTKPVLCKGCNEEKIANFSDVKSSDFYIRKGRVIKPCKQCKKDYHKKWSEGNPEYYEQWREKNPMKPADYLRKFRERHSDKD